MRISIPITSLLALVTQQIQSDLDVSYVYALQVWYIVCITFVFASLIELALAVYVMRLVHKRRGLPEVTGPIQEVTGQMPKVTGYLEVRSQGQPGVGGSQLNLTFPDQNDLDLQHQHKSKQIVTMIRKARRRIARHLACSTTHSSVDYVSRYVFPLSFAIFVLIFTCWVYD